MYKLKTEKIDSQIRLINTLLNRSRTGSASRFCFLLGAGCSASSGVPLAASVTEIIKTITFVQYHSSLNTVVRKKEERLPQFLARVNKYVAKYAIDYREFIQETESDFKSRLHNESKLYIPKKGKHFASPKQTFFIKAQFEDSLYGLWFEKYSGNPRNRQLLIEEIIEEIEPNGSYALFAYLMQTGYIQNVFTTNFDDLLNDALINFLGHKAKVYSHNDSALFIRFDNRKGNIIKLHGDFLYENIKNTLRETSSLSSNMESKFSEVLKTHDIIVVGYRGCDKSIMDVLSKVHKQHTFSVYWCDLDENQLHWRVIDFLNNCDDSHFIRIRNFDDFVFELFNSTREKIQIGLSEKAKLKENDMYQYLTNFYKNRYKRSHKICSEILARPKSVKKGKEILSIIKQSRRSVDELVRYYRLLADFNPNVDWIWNNLGIFYLRSSNYSDALHCFKKGIDINSTNPLLSYNLGVLFHDTEKLNDAQRAFKKATLLNPSFSESFNNLAATYNSQREYSKALIAINRAIAIAKRGKYLVNKGVILKNKDQVAKAIETFDEAIDSNEELERAYYNKSNALRLTKDYKEAEKYAKLAVSLDTDSEYGYCTLAQIYAEQGDSDKFYANLIEALKRNYPIWRHLDDRAFTRYKKEKKFMDLLVAYTPMNVNAS